MTLGFLVGGGLLALVVFDFFLARRPTDRPVRTAAVQFAAWSALGLAAAVPAAIVGGSDSGVSFTTVLILEKTLSIDNVAVFAAILGALSIAPADRPRLVGKGIALALVLRTGLLLAGLALVDRVHAALPVMGLLLVVMGVRMLRGHDSGSVPAGGWIRRYPVAGPLIVLALADLVFAADSIPAALAVTRDPYVVVGATGLAMLGMRPAYTLLEHGLQRLRYLSTGVAAVLVALGVELVIGHWVAVPDVVTLSVAVGLLGGSAAISTERGARWLRKAGVLSLGIALVAAGLAMLVLPGPGLVVLLAGLVALASEVPWVARLLARGVNRLPRRVQDRVPARLNAVLGRG